MNHISGMAVKTRVASITEEKLKFIEFVSKTNIGTPINGVYCDGRSHVIVLSELPVLGKPR